MPQSLLTATSVAASPSTALRGRWRAAALALLLAGAAALPARAQFAYSAAFTEYVAGTYTDLGTTGSAITVANTDDANSAAQSIGFNFQYNGQTYTQFVLNTNGFIKLGSTAPSSATLFYADPFAAANGLFASSDPADENVVAPFCADLQQAQGGTATFRMSTTGTAPNRVCTIQWKGLRDKITPPTRQLGSVEFQVRLYETTNAIDFVYGTWTASTATPNLRAAEVGIKGSASDEAVVVRKRSAETFAVAFFQDTVYAENLDASLAIRFNYRNAVMPTSGDTYRFTLPQANDAAASQIYSLGKLPQQLGAPHAVSALIINRGTSTIASLPVTLTVSGVTTFTNTQTLTNVLSGDTAVVTFAPYSPTATGTNTLTVSVPADDNNTNNSTAWTQEVTSATFRYANAGPPTQLISLGQEGVWVVRYNTSTAQTLQSIGIGFSTSTAIVGSSYTAIMTDDQGAILAQSAPYTVRTADLGQYHTFLFPAAPAVPAGDFFVGMAESAASGANPGMGLQTENVVRPGAYFVGFDLTGGGLVDIAATGFPLRPMIEATLAAPSSCQAPTNLAVGSITATGGTVTFTAAAGATGYTVNYGPAGFIPGTGQTMAVTGTTATLTGLTANTSYDVYVRTSCAGGTFSAYVGPVNFRTACVGGVLTAPYNENFDSTPANVFPCGWTTINANGDTTMWHVIDATAAGVGVASAPNELRIDNDGSTDDDDWAITPGIQLTAGLTYTLTFQYRAGNGAAPEDLEVKAGTAATVAGLTNQIFQQFGITTAAFPNQGLAQFTPATTGIYYFGFHAMTGTGAFRLYIDDVALSAGATCAAPTQLASTDVTTTEATVTFNTGGGTSFTVKYGPTGFDPTTSGTSVAATTGTVNITGLTPQTDYDFYVIRNCGAAGSSTPAGPGQFSTFCPVATITSFPYLENFDADPNQTIPCGIVVSDKNNDGYSWLKLNDDSVGVQLSNSPTNAMVYVYDDANTTIGGNDWFFLPGMQFNAGQRYRASWWQAAFAFQGTIFPEKLEVKYGTAPKASAMTTTIYPATVIGDTIYQMATAQTIQPATSGTYYIGFHAVSDPDAFLLRVDDVLIDQVTGLPANALESAVSVFPNPSTGLVKVAVAQTGARRVALRVLDNLGRVVYTGAAADNAVKQIDLSHLANGLYTVQVTLDEQTVTKQVSVQK